MFIIYLCYMVSWYLLCYTIGSVSAEHGVGQQKSDLYMKYKSITEINVAYNLKQTMDPNCILNPNKVLKLR